MNTLKYDLGIYLSEKKYEEKALRPCILLIV